MKLFILLVVCRAGRNSSPCEMHLCQLKGDLFLHSRVLCE